MRSIFLLPLLVGCGTAISESAKTPADARVQAIVVLRSDPSFGTKLGSGFNSYLGAESKYAGEYVSCIQNWKANVGTGNKLLTKFHSIKTNEDISSITTKNFKAGLTKAVSEAPVDKAADAVKQGMSGSASIESKSISDIKIVKGKVYGLFEGSKLFEPTEIEGETLTPGIDPAEFPRVCGDSYVAGQQRGAKVYALYACEYSSETNKEDITNEFKAAANAEVGGSVGLSKLTTKTNTLSNRRCEIIIEASGLPPNVAPVISTESENADAFANSIFAYLAAVTEENALPVKLLTRSYETLVRDAPSRQYWDSTQWSNFGFQLKSRQAALSNLADQLSVAYLAATYSDDAKKEFDALTAKYVDDARNFTECARDPVKSAACGREQYPPEWYKPW